MISFSEFSHRHDKAMRQMCDECDDDNCVIHGGIDGACQRLINVDDAYAAYGDDEYHRMKEDGMA